ncbi:MAG: hypothetical protein HY075_01935, partial [Deltaproteobacteria bacterium]|nr:hypothetical protein [Deltaproteobacteria bacterium]
MFQKVLSSLIAVSLCSAVALAGPAPKASFEGYVKEVAQKTGKTEKEVRDEAIEALRKEGKFDAAELERIGKGEKVELGTVKEKDMVNLLKRSESFQARTGLAALRSETIKKEGGDAFDAMKENKGTEAKADKPAKKAEPTGLEKDALLLGNIAKVVSPKAAEAIRSAGEQNYAAMKKIGTVLARRVKAGQLKAETVERLLVNAAASPKVLEGKSVLGENATEACLGMAKDA